MTDVEIDPRLVAAHAENSDRCQCQSYLRATERAALAAARWLGRADQEAAEEAAAAGMRASLDVLPIRGRVVFGSFDESVGLSPGQTLGSGGGEVDLALDPLEGRGVVARGGNGAMSMIAVGDTGKLMGLPDMYMRKLAVGPRARGSIDLLRPVAENVQAIADAFGRRVNDITTIVLDRPRHHDLIEEIRNS
ncbi:MAG: fructose,6-bisphosphatase, partial [Gaiellaceae bacterium]|nr:fructose,6-bisphosphatase [Gaiellaceae bacterium]